MACLTRFALFSCCLFGARRVYTKTRDQSAKLQLIIMKYLKRGGRKGKVDIPRKVIVDEDSHRKNKNDPTKTQEKKYKDVQAL